MRRSMVVLGVLSCLAVLAILVLVNVREAGASAAFGQTATKSDVISTDNPGTGVSDMDTDTGKDGTDACTYAWRVVTGANSGTSDNRLSNLVALSASDVWAVGTFYNGGTWNTLIEHWNGTTWSVVPSPNVGTYDNGLVAVAAVSSNDIWAVGYEEVIPNQSNHTLTLHWNGTSWSVVSSPGSNTYSNELYGVAAVSSNNVYAVGYQMDSNHVEKTLVQRWNGSSWTVLSTPNTGNYYNVLEDVTAVSSSDIWAVGYFTAPGTHDTLTLHWNGSTWSIVNSPSPSSTYNLLESVDALSSSDIWAVGYYEVNSVRKTLTMHWNGATWVFYAAQNSGTGDNELRGVSIWSSGDVWAVGKYANGAQDQALTEHWNGTSWSIVPSANLGTSTNYLNGVGATSSGYIWAAGTYYTEGSTRALFERYSLACDTPTPTSTAAASTATTTRTPTRTATRTATSLPTQTPGGSTATPAPSNTPNPGPTSCPIQFSDVAQDNTFYSNIRCLACRGIINGYGDGTFRPGNNVTRGQLAKIVSNSANFSDAQSLQLFEDVPVGSTFHVYIGRLASRGFMSGYPCGGPGEQCGAGNLPYFRPNANATRGQISKIVSNAANFNDPQSTQMFEDVPVGSAFHLYIGRLASRGYMSGYPCGAAGEPCGAGNLPYFRPGNNATRGQTSKIVGNTFFPNCQTP